METPFWPATPDNGALASPAPAHSDAQHIEPELNQLLKANVSSALIEYVADRVHDAVEYGLGQPSSSVKHHSRRAPSFPTHERAKLVEFFTKVIRRAEVSMSVILGALIYIDRARPHLRIAIQEWAHHRVFLGAVILASKYLNDSSLKNCHWAVCTGVFGRRDVARIEREFLEVLDFELGVQAHQLNLEFWNMVDARVVRSRKPLARPSVGSLGLKELNLIEFGGSVPMVRGNGNAEKRKAREMSFGDDMDVLEMQRGRRERRDALDLYAPAVSKLALRTAAPSSSSSASSSSLTITPGGGATSPASSASSSDMSSSPSTDGGDSDSSDDSSSPSAYSDASSDASPQDLRTPGVPANLSLHFPLPQPLSVPRVDALRTHARSRSASQTKASHPQHPHHHSALPLAKPVPSLALPPAPHHQLQLPLPSIPLAASRSLPPSRASSRSASPFSALAHRAVQPGAMSLYPSCLNSAGSAGMRTSHPMVPPMGSLAPPMRMVVSGAV